MHFEKTLDLCLSVRLNDSVFHMANSGIELYDPYSAEPIDLEGLSNRHRATLNRNIALPKINKRQRT